MFGRIASAGLALVLSACTVQLERIDGSDDPSRDSADREIDRFVAGDFEDCDEFYDDMTAALSAESEGIEPVEEVISDLQRRRMRFLLSGGVTEVETSIIDGGEHGDIPHSVYLTYQNPPGQAVAPRGALRLGIGMHCGRESDDMTPPDQPMLSALGAKAMVAVNSVQRHPMDDCEVIRNDFGSQVLLLLGIDEVRLTELADMETNRVVDEGTVHVSEIIYTSDTALDTYAVRFEPIGDTLRQPGSFWGSFGTPCRYEEWW